MSETMFYILFSLQEERHGYAIMQHVKELTGGRIILGAGTVYSTIGKLERDGLIKAVSEENRRKTYLITEAGNRILREEAARIAELYQHAEVLL
ncbi:MAG TPA: PadR family transcriptional regulator [Bacillota bacterium]|nr:PadR family transcriptional regulator [Bacillota bacterium]HOP68378.1 PadR family transcriptional regulator [Bacillota bacterium]HPT33453.1 PadR family transcriptional regulator [Bacillota bacterium]HPZ65184.1 PadR family transcriptional regulator [Bacillota bacterium]HQD06580.1 PadR family transcriptional regulator [Bacillota bacterium]